MFRNADADPFDGARGYPAPVRAEGPQLALCDYLRRISYKVISDHDEAEEVFRMRYQSYRALDLIGESESGEWRDRFDSHPDYRNIGIFLDGRLAGGVRINRITPALRDSAALDMYPEHLAGMLSSGSTFVEATRLFTASDQRSSDRLLPFAIIRLVGIAARHHRASHVVKNVNVRHAAFYKRHLRAEVVPDSLKPYKDHSRVVELVLLTAPVAPSYSAMLGDLPYLLSTRAEMDALFSSMPSAEHVRPGVLAVLDGTDSWA